MSGDVGNLIFPTRNPLQYYGLSISSGAARIAFAANIATTSFAGVHLFAGTYRFDVTILATVLATAAANTAVNIISTDAVGAFTTPVPLWANNVLAASFNMGAAGFQRASGSLIFAYKGGNTDDMSWNIQGITTPGSLAASYQWALTRIAG